MPQINYWVRLYSHCSKFSGWGTKQDVLLRNWVMVGRTHTTNLPAHQLGILSPPNLQRRHNNADIEPKTLPTQKICVLHLVLNMSIHRNRPYSSLAIQDAK